jgi:hypothetical protein
MFSLCSCMVYMFEDDPQHDDEQERRATHFITQLQNRSDVHNVPVFVILVSVFFFPILVAVA